MEVRERRQANPEKARTELQNYRTSVREKDPKAFYENKRAKHKLWRDSNMEKVVALRRKKLRAYRYGLSEEEFLRKVEEQDGSCRICERDAKLQVDHDHKTGKIRGLLCVNCNRGIGYLKDSLRIIEAAAEYLRQNGGGYGD